MNSHLTWERFAAFADGSAPPEEAAAIAAHISECQPCAAQLTHFAQLDMAIYKAAVEPVQRREPMRRWLLVAASLVAIFSAGLAYRFTHASGEVLDLGDIVCPDGDDQATCIAHAQAHGLAVSYPQTAGVLAEFQPLAGEYR